MIASITLLSAHAAAALLSAIWQGALLALCAAVCLRLLPRLSAATRSAIWMTVFAIAVSLHFVPSTHATSSSPEVHAAPVWSLVFVALWLACTLFRAGQLLVSILRVRQVNRRAVPLSVGCYQAPAIGRRYQVCTSPDVDRPSVLGFFSPRVLLPVGLAEKLSPAELHQVLLHETEHLRRSDDWTNLLQKLALVVFPLNPALLYIERRLCEERELACDDRVLSSAANNVRKTYATCLTQLAEHAIFRRGLSLALGAWHRQSELSRRVYRILAPAESLMPPRAARFAATGLALTLAATGGVLARTPRLISFDPVPQPTEQAFVLRDTAAAKPVLAKALVSPTTLGAPGLASETWVRSRTKPHRKPRHQSTPQFLSTTWRSVTPAPRLTITLQTAYIEPTPQPAPPQPVARLQPVQSQSSVQAVPAVYRVPVAYAAFHTPDGWIIIQL
jgi:beta-lactamase regulating signal transducer with metallopeptidase domain